MTREQVEQARRLMDAMDAMDAHTMPSDGGLAARVSGMGPSWVALVRAFDNLRQTLGHSALMVIRVGVAEGIPVRGDEESVLPADTVATLVELARSNAEQDFRDLAAMSGVAPEQLDEFWAGTRQRLGRPAQRR